MGHLNMSDQHNEQTGKRAVRTGYSGVTKPLASVFVDGRAKTCPVRGLSIGTRISI